MSDQAKSAPPEEQRLLVHYDTTLPKLSRWRRLQIPVIAWAVRSVIRIIGPTLRYEVLGGGYAQRDHRPLDPPYIFAFWHRCIFASCWYFRHRGIVLMNTTNFDGQWTRRAIEPLGYGTAQGSSSRGGLRGLAVMARRLAEGLDVAFTIDGPRGPRYVAKPGAAMLARRTGRPVILLHVGVERSWTLQNAWDLFQIPKPFSRAVLVMAPPVIVPEDAGREELEQKHGEIQMALDRTRDTAEKWFALSPAERERERAVWNSRKTLS